MPYPDRYLAEGEEVVRRLHPHWSTLAGPVLVLLLVVGGSSFGAALVPAGPQQGMVRLGIVVVAGLALLLLVLRPLLRWRTTQYVITTHRLLYREGVLARRGRDIALSRITDVSYEQSLGQRILRSGTLFVETAGDSGPTVLRTVPDSDGVSQLLSHMLEEDAERRAGRPVDPYAGWAATGDVDDRRY